MNTIHEPTIHEPGEACDPIELLSDLRHDGVQLWIEDGRIRYRAPKGVMTEQRLELVKLHRDRLLDELMRQLDLATMKADAPAAFEPFPLTHLQAAYLLGRRAVFESGGVGCHGYLEYRVAHIDVFRLQAAWRALIARHSMLRAVFLDDGTQTVLPSTPPFQIQSSDADDLEAEVTRRRDQMSHRVYSGSEWPLFAVAVTRGRQEAVMHISFDLLIADFISFGQILAELETLYESPDAVLPPIGATFRDYVIAVNGSCNDATAQRSFDSDKQWWLERIPALPGMPELPLQDNAAQLAPPRFERHKIALAVDDWKALREAAAANSITASAALLAAFCEIIAKWNRSGQFTLGLTLLDRQPLHPDINRVVGDFTALDLFAVHHDATQPFTAKAKACQAQLWADLGHRKFSGVEVAREIARQKGFENARFPVVFTSTLGSDIVEAANARWSFTKADYGITQTPQVWLDCQVVGNCGGIAINWDVRSGVFPAGLIAVMAGCFQDLLLRLARTPESWLTNDPVSLPAAQLERRARANQTAAPVSTQLLHERALRYAARDPHKIAVICGESTLSFGELHQQASNIAGLLRDAGLQPGELVAVVLPKSTMQIVAVFGVLVAGGAYLPIDTYQPAARRSAIIRDASVRLVITNAARGGQEWPLGVGLIYADAAPPMSSVERQDKQPKAQPTSIAYAIYTSGSTGQPKGAILSHQAAGNTLDDINHRLGVVAEDAVLGLAHLGFDLSVYDIFGVLGCGGTLVLPLPDRLCDASFWVELLREHRITLWNSVPAQMQMLIDYLGSIPDPAVTKGIELRTILLSGDWIPTDLPARIWAVLPQVQLISLGGATEAGIWSIIHPIRGDTRGQRSVPYGVPMRNQQFHVLDAALHARPDLVAGDLYIGGLGLADGYIADPQKTAQSFIRHPETGARLYRTGDVGRYREDGEIELLGREDRQVKIRGHRIELSEIESAASVLPDVQLAAAVVVGSTVSTQRLSLAVELRKGAGPVDADRIRIALESLLPPYMVPADILIVPALPLTSNGKIDRKAICASFDALATPRSVAAEGAANALLGKTEASVAGIFAKVLGKPVTHRDDDFMALGGNSLLASNVAAETLRSIEIDATMNFDQLLVALLTHRTVASFSAALTPKGLAGATTALVASADGGSSDTVVCIGISIDAHEEKQLTTLLDGIAPHAATVSLAVADAQAFAALELRALVDRIVDACYDNVASRFAKQEFILIGQGAASVAALELGRRLRESGRGVPAVVAIAPAEKFDSPRLQRWRQATAQFALFPYTADVVIVGPDAGTEVDWDDIALGDVRRFDARQPIVPLLTQLIRERSAS